METYLRFATPLSQFSFDRRYFASNLWYAGWVPRHAQESDLICAFYGRRFPFVIRPKGEEYELVGACYMYGIMERETIELPNTEGDAEGITITLVWQRIRGCVDFA